MDQEKIWSHISRKITGEETNDDIEQVDKWLSEKPSNRKVYNNLVKIWKSKCAENDDNSTLYESLRRKIVVYESRPIPFISRINTWVKVAAILAVIMASNFLVYQYFNKTEPTAVSWQEIVVPRGNRMKVILPDNSSVWLNNESHLRYATDFSSGNRLVELSGEAYFDISHDAQHPFVVKVGNQSIKVLGTRFSVNAYPEDQTIETSLISGSVEFDCNKEVNGKSKYMIEPGISLFYDKNNNTVTTEKIKTSYYQYWENGVYAFKEESFEDLAVKIKRIFNVEIIFKDEYLKKKRYTGTISINDNIFLFMEAIRRTSVEPIVYEYNKNIINVKLK